MHRFLIIQTASLGDVILSTSLAETIHKSYPDAEISYLIKKGYESLFAGHPFIHEVLIWDKSKKKYHNLLKIILKVRAARYDGIINIQRFASSGIVSAFSGAPFRSGFTKNPLSFTFTLKQEHLIDGSAHEINRNMKLIEPLVNGPVQMPALYPGTADVDYVKQWKDKPYITISPASLYFTKQLPADNWIGLTGKILTLRVILLGSRADESLCEKIRETSPHSDIINLAGRLSFLQSASVMKDAVMNYVNDSAPMHIASSVDANVAAVFCSTVPSFGFGPLSKRSYIIQTDVPLTCKPCGLHGYQKCPLGHFKCAETISLDQLLLPLNYERRDQS